MRCHIRLPLGNQLQSGDRREAVQIEFFELRDHGMIVDRKQRQLQIAAAGVLGLNGDFWPAIGAQMLLFKLGENLLGFLLTLSDSGQSARHECRNFCRRLRGRSCGGRPPSNT